MDFLGPQDLRWVESVMEKAALQLAEHQDGCQANEAKALVVGAVLEKAVRVKELRAEVPALISQSVQGEMESLRPLVASIEQFTALTPPREDAGDNKSEGHLHQVQPHPDGEELQALLAGTLDKLPALRWVDES
eukprot:1151886-Pelagomonas_calceolata.AAC.5